MLFLYTTDGVAFAMPTPTSSRDAIPRRDRTATGGRSEGHSREPVSLIDLGTTRRPPAAIPLVHTHHGGTDRGPVDTGSRTQGGGPCW